MSPRVERPVYTEGVTGLNPVSPLKGGRVVWFSSLENRRSEAPGFESHPSRLGQVAW